MSVALRQHCTRVLKTDKKIRILVADDHFVVRMGLIALVNTEADMTVIGEASDGVKPFPTYVRAVRGGGS